MISQEKLRSVLAYCPETGLFTRIKDGRIAGSTRNDGYIAICIDYAFNNAHRLAFLYMTGEMPNGEVDHINGNRSDNRWANLRECSREQNRMNLKVYKNSATGVPGVSWHKHMGKWHARIGSGGKRISLGYFASIEEASVARQEAQRVVFGEFARHV